ncbi:hypothetical protein FRC14_008220 [Serendipita sp. 396]|nr:hypothetical protein FRC14_008220 [Serendipita sp. 396]KAG8852166.1 hypothetical protein FRC20_001589 [Serendipita sp. 405]
MCPVMVPWSPNFLSKSNSSRNELGHADSQVISLVKMPSSTPPLSRIGDRKRSSCHPQQYRLFALRLLGRVILIAMFTVSIDMYSGAIKRQTGNHKGVSHTLNRSNLSFVAAAVGVRLL